MNSKWFYNWKLAIQLSLTGLVVVWLLRSRNAGTNSALAFRHEEKIESRGTGRERERWIKQFNAVCCITVCIHYQKMNRILWANIFIASSLAFFRNIHSANRKKLWSNRSEPITTALIGMRTYHKINVKCIECAQAKNSTRAHIWASCSSCMHCSNFHYHYCRASGAEYLKSWA